MQGEFNRFFYKRNLKWHDDQITFYSYDKEFRKLVEENVPGADKALKILLQEEKPLEDLSKKLDEYTSAVTGFFGGGSDSSKEESKSVKSKNLLMEKWIKITIVFMD